MHAAKYMDLLNYNEQSRLCTALLTITIFKQVRTEMSGIAKTREDLITLQYRASYYLKIARAKNNGDIDHQHCCSVLQRGIQSTTMALHMTAEKG